MSEHPRRRSPRRNAQAWQVLLEEQRMSGLTVTAFCRQVAISPASFYRWQGRLQPQGVSGRGATVSDANVISAVTARMATSHPSDFVDLGALEDLAAPTRQKEAPLQRVELRLDLGAGLVLHLVRE